MYILIASALLTLLLLFLFIPILKKSFLDIPNSRSSHANPTPRGGGAAFVLVSLVFSIFAISTTPINRPLTPFTFLASCICWFS